MRRFPIFCLTLSLVLAVTPPLCADDAANALLDRAIKALGGEANLARFHAATWKAKGTFHLDNRSVDYTGEWTVDLPERYRCVLHTEVNGRQVRQVRVLNGDKGWSKRDDGDAEEMNAETLEEARRELQALWVATLLPLRDRNAFSLSSLEDTQIGDQPAAGLQAKNAEGRTFRLFCQRETGLPLQFEYTVKDLRADKEVTQEILYSRYQESESVKWPARVVLRRDGKVLLEQEVSDYKSLEKPDAKAFSKP